MENIWSAAPKGKANGFGSSTDSVGRTTGGIVKSQTQEGTFYASWIDHQGRYSCYDHDLEACRGTQDAVELLASMSWEKDGNCLMAAALCGAR